MFPATGVGIRSFVVISVRIWVYQAHIPGNWHEIRQDISDVVVEHRSLVLDYDVRYVLPDLMSVAGNVGLVHPYPTD